MRCQERGMVHADVMLYRGGARHEDEKVRNKRLEPGMVLLSNEFCRFCKGKKGTWRFRGGVSLYGERKGYNSTVGLACSITPVLGFRMVRFGPLCKIIILPRLTGPQLEKDRV
ncbi:predicted protein [Sclerotinia sclerotiorum 1980 UF-70]|uniref:Uncharacterized protein n=1 Tax=Sclerotinia sclerotiorum (strain ATCC 18683 / 1980 / Ss-1) TaxID=665079 RepID=A7E4Y7_SCLS1|nr:predicted protein [Sclerotinia sclerotiorum 1980 UF-70]EDN90959.1 predicted protein [Sclerotinia sclerotiorum 1980 UF-70]